MYLQGTMEKKTCSSRIALCITVIFCLVYFSPKTNAQQITAADEWKMVEQKESFKAEFSEKTVKYGSDSKRKSINPMYHAFSLGIFTYQKFVSPVLARDCAYSTSCSDYSKQLVSRYGVLVGVVCTADRLMRCNRIALADPMTYLLMDSKDKLIHETVERYASK